MFLNGPSGDDRLRFREPARCKRWQFAALNEADCGLFEREVTGFRTANPADPGSGRKPYEGEMGDSVGYPVVQKLNASAAQ